MSRNKDIQKWAQEPELPIDKLEGADPEELKRIRQNRSVDSALVKTFRQLKSLQDEALAERTDATRFENLLQANLAKEVSASRIQDNKAAEKYVLDANSDRSGLFGYLFGENRTLAWGALGVVFVVMSAVFYFTGPFDSSLTEQQAVATMKQTESAVNEESGEDTEEAAAADFSDPEKSEKSQATEEKYAAKGPGFISEKEPDEPPMPEEVAMAETEATSRTMQPPEPAEPKEEAAGNYNNQALSASKEAELKMAVLRSKTDSDKKAALIRLRDYYHSQNRPADAERIQKRIDSTGQ